ncbi:hypothetical protein OS11_11480 [Dickeya oryzae]
MVWRNTSTRYGYISVLLHWASAITVYGMFALGLWMVTLGYYNPWYHNAPEIHKGIGILLFLTLLFSRYMALAFPSSPGVVKLFNINPHRRYSSACFPVFVVI